MKQILIVDSDEQFASRLSEALQALGDFTVVSAPAAREAYLVIAQSTPDLAFVPAKDDGSLVRSLHTLQPDLKLVVMVDEPEATVPEAYQSVVHAIMPKSEMETQLDALVSDLFESDSSIALAEEHLSDDVPTESESDEPDRVDQQDPSEPPHLAAKQTTSGTESLGQMPAELAELLRQAMEKNEQFHGLFLALPTGAVEHWVGELSDADVLAIVEPVTRFWESGRSGQVQFGRLASRSSDTLIYAVPVSVEKLLIVAAAPTTSVGDVRVATETVARQIASVQGGKPASGREPVTITIRTEVEQDVEAMTSYALAWRPRQSMPPALHDPVRKALERVAQVYEFELHDLEVSAELVHLVVDCPANRTSAWLVYRLKKGAEDAIREQFGVEARMWEQGYYAVESEEPLTATELGIFLGRGAEAGT